MHWSFVLLFLYIVLSQHAFCNRPHPSPQIFTQLLQHWGTHRRRSRDVPEKGLRPKHNLYGVMPLSINMASDPSHGWAFLVWWKRMKLSASKLNLDPMHNPGLGSSTSPSSWVVCVCCSRSTGWSHCARRTANKAVIFLSGSEYVPHIWHASSHLLGTCHAGKLDCASPAVSIVATNNHRPPTQTSTIINPVSSSPSAPLIPSCSDCLQ